MATVAIPTSRQAKDKLTMGLRHRTTTRALQSLRTSITEPSMQLPIPPPLLLACLFVLGLAGCAETSQPAVIATAAAAQAAATPAPSLDPATAQATPVATTGLPAVLVHKQESCGCCGAWVEHMREAGFAVEVRNLEDVQPVKSRLGVPDAMVSCHTAEIAGYFIEGHVPASDIKRLLQERPDAKGLALPGMPIGSPGMEHPDGLRQPYIVSLIDRNGQALPFSQHNQP